LRVLIVWFALVIPVVPGRVPGQALEEASCPQEGCLTEGPFLAEDEAIRPGFRKDRNGG
jgi:hypothetical protein